MAGLVLSVVIVTVGSSLRVYELGTVTPKFFFLDYTLLTLTMLIVGGRKGVTVRSSVSSSSRRATSWRATWPAPT